MQPLRPKRTLTEMHFELFRNFLYSRDKPLVRGPQISSLYDLVMEQAGRVAMVQTLFNPQFLELTKDFVDNSTTDGKTGSVVTEEVVDMLYKTQETEENALAKDFIDDLILLLIMLDEQNKSYLLVWHLEHPED